MRRTITLQPNDEYAFDIGRNALILILRNATENVIFKGDSLTAMVLSHGDIVDVQAFRQKRMFLANETERAVTLEFQLSDVPISIREQRITADGGVLPTEIISPVQVSRVLEPVKVAGTIPVSMEGGIEAHFPPEMALSVTVKEILKSIAISNLPDVQKVQGEVSISSLPSALTQVRGLPSIVIGASGLSEIAENLNRKGVMVQASGANKGDVTIAGFMRIKPDGVATIPAWNALAVQGTEGDSITIGEVY